MKLTSNDSISNNQEILKDYPLILLNDLFTFHSLELICLTLVLTVLFLA